MENAAGLADSGIGVNASFPPPLRSVRAISDHELDATFADGRHVIYDMQPLFAKEVFAPLRDPVLFHQVRMDPGGYGVSWNDQLDLAEWELYSQGTIV